MRRFRSLLGKASPLLAFQLPDSAWLERIDLQRRQTCSEHSSLALRLIGANLACRGTGRNAPCTDLSAANLRNSNLRAANLSGAILDGADLSGANLQDACFAGARLFDVKMDSANLKDAEFPHAELISVSVAGIDTSIGFSLPTLNLEGTERFY